MKETDVLPRKKGKKKMKYHNVKGNKILLTIYHKDTPSTLL